MDQVCVVQVIVVKLPGLLLIKRQPMFLDFLGGGICRSIKWSGGSQVLEWVLMMRLDQIPDQIDRWGGALRRGVVGRVAHDR